MTRRAAILFLLTQDLESPSGLGRYWPLARELARLGHPVTIATLHPDFSSLKETRFRRDGVDIWYVAPMHVQKRGNHKSYYSTPQLIGVTMRATAALTRAALSVRADVVHVGKPHPMNSVAGLIGSKARGTRLFLDCDDYEAALGHFGGDWQRRGVSLFEDNMPRHVDHITTHTGFNRDRLLELGIPAAKITYLPNGVERERFAEPAAAAVETLRANLDLAGRQVVGYFGSLSLPSHPLSLLLEAFEQVRALRSGTVLLLVGGGEAFEPLRQRFPNAGAGQSVVLAGHVPPAHVPLYYRLADVSVDPVFDDDVARGRCPLKMFESWASGVPFVTGDVGDRRLLSGTPAASALTRPGDPTALAMAIVDVLDHREVANALRQRGLDRVQRFWWDELVTDVERLYEL
jgi:glycosyltransferase involved in cell wall biosynthesis